MKKLVPFFVVLGVLTASISYYIFELKSSVLFEEKIPQNIAGPIKLHHPDWDSQLIPLKDNRVRLDSSGSLGTITNLSYGKFSIIWDDYGIETFTQNPQTGIYNLTEKKDKEKQDTK